MPLYRVIPFEENLNHIDWQASTWRQQCLVMAANENKAAEYLYRDTGISVQRDQVSGVIPTNPWRNTSLVSYHEANPINDIPEEGWVELDGGP